MTSSFYTKGYVMKVYATNFEGEKIVTVEYHEVMTLGDEDRLSIREAVAELVAPYTEEPFAVFFEDEPVDEISENIVEGLEQPQYPEFDMDGTRFTPEPTAEDLRLAAEWDAAGRPGEFDHIEGEAGINVADGFKQ